MSKRYSIWGHVFSSIWSVTEATAVLIHARSTTLQTFGRIHGSLLNPKKYPLRLYRSKRGPRDWPVPPNPSIWKSFIQRFSDCKAPAWRETILLKYLFSVFPRATSLHLNNYDTNIAFCWGGNCHYAFVSYIGFSSATIGRAISYHEQFSAVISNDALLFPTSLKLCD
jgi:hypothetical protein